MINFCTLFDSYYIDKGLALYESLHNVCQDFCLYVFCFDDLSFKILNDLKLKNMIVLSHKNFENSQLLELKKQRSKAEYCWTCTPIIVEYVLDNYNVESCTYLDSDLYFYSNPSVLFEEINTSNSDVVVVEHRFDNTKFGKKLEKRNGKYCVEFNYFSNNSNARNALTWWKERCLEWCFDIPEEDRMGDQKYLNKFPLLFEGVHELQHLGGGVAPWNLSQYTLDKQDGKNIILKTRTGDRFPLVFYHFQNIRYMPNRKVNLKSLTSDKKVKYSIYIPYLKCIETIRKSLIKEYNLDFNPKKLVRSSNKIMGFLQSRFAFLKIRHISDILDLDKLDDYGVRYE